MPYSIFCEYERKVDGLQKKLQESEIEQRRDKLIQTEREHVLQNDLRKLEFDLENKERYFIYLLYDILLMLL